MIGHAVILGDNVNTDLLHPPAYFATDAAEAAKGAFAGLPGGVRALGPPPWIIVAGENFGCGSSRESTLRALKQAGVAGVVARSFSHIFRRNAVNAGLPVGLLLDVAPGLKAGAELALEDGVLVTPTGRLQLAPPDPWEQEIIRAGGLANLLEANSWDWPAKGDG